MTSTTEYYITQPVIVTRNYWVEAEEGLSKEDLIKSIDFSQLSIDEPFFRLEDVEFSATHFFDDVSVEDEDGECLHE